MLKRIREKPHHIKQSISLAITIIIFSGILFVWVSSWDARARDQEVRDKTVSPITGVTSMFDGFVSGFKEKMSGTPTLEKASVSSTTPTDTFDLSGVVIIDPALASTTMAN
ncbi:MAG: hypothetical protein HZB11_02575 [Candidatus Yonathbacteria bacterium]|nr:hypothetical protein [Candidatus Yonathbacteria bacterium]